MKTTFSSLEAKAGTARQKKIGQLIYNRFAVVSYFSMYGSWAVASEAMTVCDGPNPERS